MNVLSNKGVIIEETESGLSAKIESLNISVTGENEKELSKKLDDHLIIGLINEFRNSLTGLPIKDCGYRINMFRDSVFIFEPETLTGEEYDELMDYCGPDELYEDYIPFDRVDFWIIISDDDDLTMSDIIRAEAKVNAKYYDFSAGIDCTILEESIGIKFSNDFIKC